MAVTVERKYNGDSGTRFKDWSLQYLVRGTNDSIEAMNEAWTAAPATINTASAPIILNVVKTPYPTVEPVHVDIGAEPACIWLVTVSYSAFEVPTNGKELYEESTTASGSAHITQSYEVVSHQGVYPSDTLKVIGAKLDGSIGGFDIPSSERSINVTRWQTAEPSAAFKDTIDDMTPSVNDSTVVMNGVTYTKRELLFRGLELGPPEKERSPYQVFGTDLYRMTYHFSVKRDESSISVGALTVDKVGWDAMDVLYGRASLLIGGKTFVMPTPIGVQMHRVFRETDFDGLGLDGIA